MSSAAAPVDLPFIEAAEAISQIKQQLRADTIRAAILCFNILPDQLPTAYQLLDKVKGRKSMRLTYSNEHNFIIKYCPFAHPTYVDWGSMLIRSLDALLNQGASADLGIEGGWAPTFTTDIEAKASRMHQPGTCFGPDANPNLVIEVGNNALQEQLRADAKLWLESPVVFSDLNFAPVSVQFVIIICVDDPLGPDSTFPQINIEHWTLNDQDKVTMVWSGNWTQETPPSYSIPLRKLFAPLPVPDGYGGIADVDIPPECLSRFRARVIRDWPRNA